MAEVVLFSFVMRSTSTFLGGGRSSPDFHANCLNAFENGDAGIAAKI